MLDVVLYQPEILRTPAISCGLAANTGMRLHLVKPLGFRLSDRALKRAGLDYGALADVRVHLNWETCASSLAPQRCFAFTTRGAVGYTEAAFAAGDALVFGRKRAGSRELPRDNRPERRLRIPMRAGAGASTSRTRRGGGVRSVAAARIRRCGADGSGGSRPPRNMEEPCARAATRNPKEEIMAKKSASEGVYRVIDAIGTSKTSWEEAAGTRSRRRRDRCATSGSRGHQDGHEGGERQGRRVPDARAALVQVRRLTAIPLLAHHRGTKARGAQVPGRDIFRGQRGWRETRRQRPRTLAPWSSVLSVPPW